MTKKIKIGIIGLGCRGKGLLEHTLVHFDFLSVAALCDVREERIEAALAVVNARETDANVFRSTDYRQVLAQPLDCVLIACDWKYHAAIACEAMEKGIPVACEVGGAASVEECFRLVETYEKTNTPIFFLENCCFDKTETTVANMVKDGLFGSLVYCSGAYGHDLREEVSNGCANGHYREEEYQTRNCENYPTHELGPIAKLLNVNHGNRFVSLSSMASGAFGLADYIARGKKHDEQAEKKPFVQADVIITNITCENGALITLKLDTTLPRSYHREFAVAGTKGRYTALSDEVFLDGDDEWKKSKSLADYPQYLPDCWNPQSEESLKKRGHGGMDYLEFEAFFDCLLHNKPMPIDVYDMAAWMVITPLSEQSLREGKCVPVPDFTRGKYKTR